MTIAAFAEFTLREAVRRRVVLATAIVTLAFIGLYSVGVWFGWRDLQSEADLTAAMRRAVIGVMLQGGLWSLNFVSSLLAIFLAVGAISGEIAEGTMHAVAARPVRRWEIVLGKYAGYVLMLAVFIGAASAALIVVVGVITGHIGEGVWVAPFPMLLSASVLLALTMAGSSRFGSLANGVVVFTLFATALVGGVVEQMGAFLDNVVTFDIGVFTGVLLPTRVLWDMAGAQIDVGAWAAAGGGPFTSISPPSGWMILLGFVYIALMLGLAIRWFSRRDI